MPQLLSVVAIAEIFPEGQKTVAFAMEYDCEIKLTGQGPEAFQVTDHSLEPLVPPSDRIITRVYTNTSPSCASQGKPGCYVILETDTHQKESFSILPFDRTGQPSVFGPGPMCHQRDGKSCGDEELSKHGPGPELPYCGPKPLKILVSQHEELHAADGTPVPSSAAPCTELICPETERFQLYQYEDIPYNLFVPDDYDPHKEYPLVLFIPDAGGRGEDPLTPLLQGIGGVAWTSPEDQKKHPCFVICPAFGPEDILTHDDFTCMDKLYKVKGILDDICREYSIDKSRIYTTGQSMGCMSSCELMCKWPDYFAGAILVAGQWDPVRCGKAMWNSSLWILVSENDRKAHPGMDAVTSEIERCGGTVARFRWDGSADEEVLSKDVADALKQNVNVRYTVFSGDTVVPPDQEASPGSNHTNTWRVAYQIPALRDWLFSVSRQS